MASLWCSYLLVRWLEQIRRFGFELYLCHLTSFRGSDTFLSFCVFICKMEMRISILPYKVVVKNIKSKRAL